MISQMISKGNAVLVEGGRCWAWCWCRVLELSNVKDDGRDVGTSLRFRVVVMMW